MRLQRKTVPSTRGVMDGRDTLRTLLRRETASRHAALDADIGSDLVGHGYGEMLSRQYRARAGIEAWFESAAPKDLTPPPQTPALAADLVALACEVPLDNPAFVAASDGFLGVAWAIAGSHLGNRAMVAARRKAGAAGADSFLRDEAMARYWKDLLPHLTRAAADDEVRAAVRGAEAVFTHFLALRPASAVSEARAA